MDYVIRRDVRPGHRGDSVFYTVHWSPIAKADKYEIVKKAPAIGGIAELYYMDEKGKLNLFCLQRSWYGGIRAMLRERCDASLEKDPFRLSILVKWQNQIYYRWTNCESLADMNDVMFFFTETYSPGQNAVQSSGRYSQIFVNEIDTGKLVTI
ncbi:MAG TPA: hypothetical protein VMC79_08225 [Rectinemataceae bacterium]|nr:hypothetical protein [Rectinemataceae bacterium]